jgi:hypothetical protein
MFQGSLPTLSQIDHDAERIDRLRLEAERSIDPEDVVAMVLSRWQASAPRYGHQTIHPFGPLLEAFQADRSLTTAERLALASRIVDDMAEAMDQLTEMRMHGRA